MNFQTIIKIAQELEQSGYSDYARDVVNDAVELQNISMQSAEDTTQIQNPQDLSQSDVDKFIGAILSEEASHNNIRFNDQGKLELESIRAIINSFEQLLLNADMS